MGTCACRHAHRHVQTNASYSSQPHRSHFIEWHEASTANLAAITPVCGHAYRLYLGVADGMSIARCPRACPRACLQTCAYTRVHTHVCTHTCTRMSTHMSAHMYRNSTGEKASTRIAMTRP